MITKKKHPHESEGGSYFLDITGDVCPLTFVKTKLLLEKIPPGSIAEIRLNEGEPLENVPRSVREDGHTVLALGPEPDTPEVYRLRIRRN